MKDACSVSYLLIHRAKLLSMMVLEAQNLGVQFQAGMELKADVFLAVDGVRSFSRSSFLGKPDPPTPTGRLVYRFTVSLKKMRQHPSLPSLVDPPMITSWPGPASHVACYTLKSNELFNVVLTRPGPIKERVQFGPRRANIEDLRKKF